MQKIETMRGLREAFKAKENVFAHKRWATEEEGELLYNLTIQNQTARVVEIGTANGWTAAWFSLAGAEVYTFDMIDRPKMYLDSLFPYSEVVEHIHFTCATSPDCLKLLTPSDKKTLWFIDALHTDEATMTDFRAVMEVAKSGDVIVQHDTIGEVGSARTWRKTVAMNVGDSHLYTTRNGVGVINLY